MSHQTITGFFRSSNDKSKLKYVICIPESTPKAVLQISHGMCEYLERYEDFATYLTSFGYVVCGHNHLGHKGSVENEDELGYFGEKDGWKCMVEDVAKMTYELQKRFPDLPIFLFGHSMGSFIARIYLTRYASLLQGCILCGTSGSNPLTTPGRLCIRTIRLCKGSHHRSPWIQKLMFGNYNNRYPDHKTNVDWISTDATIVEKYILDPFCIFIFTTAGFMDLTKLLAVCNSKPCYSSIPSSLPLLIMSGEMDPVGQFTKGPKEVYRKLKKNSARKVSLTLYPNARHELINEIHRDIVYEDIKKWLDAQL